METSARLYTLNYNEAKTYMWAAIFVACNLVLPVMAFKLAGGLGELALTGGIEATIQDFTIGWPGLLLQVFGAYIVCRYL